MIMIDIFMAAICIALVGLIGYEIINEARGSSGKLHDRYHE